MWVIAGPNRSSAAEAHRKREARGERSRPNPAARMAQTGCASAQSCCSAASPQQAASASHATAETSSALPSAHSACPAPILLGCAYASGGGTISLPARYACTAALSDWCAACVLPQYWGGTPADGVCSRVGWWRTARGSHAVWTAGGCIYRPWLTRGPLPGPPQPFTAQPCHASRSWPARRCSTRLATQAGARGAAGSSVQPHHQHAAAETTKQSATTSACCGAAAAQDAACLIWAAGEQHAMWRAGPVGRAVGFPQEPGANSTAAEAAWYMMIHPQHASRPPSAAEAALFVVCACA